MSQGDGISARDGIDSIEANAIVVSGVSVTGGSTTGVRRIKTRTGGFSGGIAISRLLNDGSDPGIHIAGELDGNVSIGNSLSPIDVGSMDITNIISVSGYVRANITSSGTLGRLRVTGTLGAIGTPVTVTAGQAIGEISASAVTGSVISTSGGVGPVTVPNIWIGSLDVASVASFSVGTWTEGIATIRDEIPVAAALTFRSLSSTGSIQFPHGLAGRLLISESLLGSVLLPANGLDGQIVVNSNNGSGDWTGSVTVGTTTLSPVRYYTQASSASDPLSTLGSGAVGLAPFHLYKQDSSPVHGGYRLVQDFSEMNPVYVSYYGPLARRPGSGTSALATVWYHTPYTPLSDIDETVGIGRLPTRVSPYLSIPPTDEG